MQAYDVKRKRLVNVERAEGDIVIAYSLPDAPDTWYFPLIENGRNVERFEMQIKAAQAGEGERDE